MTRRSRFGLSNVRPTDRSIVDRRRTLLCMEIAVFSLDEGYRAGFVLVWSFALEGDAVRRGGHRTEPP